MKIGILTQPLLKNYGGILQAYALQLTLKRLGHEAWLVQRCGKTHRFHRWLRNRIGYALRYALRRKRINWIYRRTEKNQCVHTQRFIDEYIVPKTSKIFSTRGLRQDYKKQGYDAYVVGSDQVWRPKYSPCQTDYYIGFLPVKESVKRLAYAASFGTDKWEYTDELSRRCKVLLRYFDGVSVREESAISLCHHYLGRNDALQVLDPTLLLEKEDYERLIDAGFTEKKNKKIFCYMLDDNSAFENLRQEVSNRLNGECITITFTGNRPIPGPISWLQAFMEADYVLTDSFHGCVFSIIFNRPFVAIGNEERGQTRFISLLQTFGLTSRLVSSKKIEEIIAVMKESIDWDKINARKLELKNISLEFIRKKIGGYE